MVGRSTLVALTAMVLVWVLAAPAQAATGPSGSVTPNTGLVDGQVVTVTGSNLPQPLISNGYVVSQCDSANLGPTPDLNAALFYCDLNTDHYVTELHPVRGSISTPFPVRAVIQTEFRGPVDCSVDACSLLIAQFTTVGFTTVVLPISFGPATPASKADCKGGGWRQVVDGQGRAFKNQGQCIKFVNHQR